MSTPVKKTKRRPAANPFPAGLRIGVIQVLDQRRDAPYAKGKSWWVRYSCCGLEVERGYSTLAAFLQGPPLTCGRCARHGLPPASAPAPLALDASALRRAQAAIHPADAWPRPPSLAGQAPGVWGVQP